MLRHPERKIVMLNSADAGNDLEARRSSLSMVGFCMPSTEFRQDVLIHPVLEVQDQPTGTIIRINAAGPYNDDPTPPELPHCWGEGVTHSNILSWPSGGRRQFPTRTKGLCVPSACLAGATGDNREPPRQSGW